MPAPNRKCLICKTPYYACSASLNLAQGSWRATFCSPECYQEWLRIQESKKSKSVEVIVDEQPTRVSADIAEESAMMFEVVDTEEPDGVVSDDVIDSVIESTEVSKPKRSKKRETTAEV